MAYIGAVAPGYDPTRASVPQLDAERFSGNSSTTAFTLTRQVVSPTDINVIVGNVIQEPTVAYTVSGYTLNFTEAPGSGTNNIYVIYRASATSNYAYVPDGSITYAKLANNIRQFTVDTFTANGTGTTVTLTETPASANSLIVSIDGVIQTAPTNYTLSGNTITFTGTPDNGANVVVKHIGFRTTSTVTALQASSVTATELADGAVTNAKLAGSITSDKITSVSNSAITGVITTNQLQNITGGLQPEQIDALINFFKKRVNALITKYKFIEKQQFETMIKNKQGSITNQSTKESTVIKNINERDIKVIIYATPNSQVFLDQIPESEKKAYESIFDKIKKDICIP